VRIAAGFLVLVSVVLGWVVHPSLLGIAAFVGAGLVFAGFTDTCGMGMLLARMPWNQVKEPETTDTASEGTSSEECEASDAPTSGGCCG
jgi:hypothetical protein